MPGIFSRIDSILKRYFSGMSTAEVSPTLPPGTVAFGEKWVESSPLRVPGRQSTCFVRGKVDSILRFQDGSYGVIDFKTSAARGHQASLYARQLHSYAYALENPAPGRLNLAPISRLGLLCLEPVEVLGLGEGACAYRTEPTWVECPRDDRAFLAFIGEVLAVLDLPGPPEPGPTCRWCRYLDAVHRNLPH